ncbi:MAG: histidine phosphatase family protein [Eubacteriaceae bacterium]|jgi:CTP:molybdopterin cytidylyltransferase MocA/broad specificity phosphatase PhoE|nr:histidine phosphatase family protein [Eubacteriaceae bacterium]
MIGAVILAAGYTARSGELKAMKPIGGEPAIERVIKTVREAGIDDIVIVTGYRRERLAEVIEKYHLKEAYDRGYARGVFSYVNAGIDAIAADNVEGFFLVPSDWPAIKAESIRLILAKKPLIEKEFDQQGKAILVPMYYGKPGFPVYIPNAYKEQAVQIERDRELKQITAENIENIHCIETQSESTIMNIDTDKDYKRVRRYCEAGSVDEDIHELAKGHRFILIRHALVERPIEKVFFGQSDFQLSAKGIEQATKLGIQMQKGQYRTDHIYSSNLSRAVDTAEIIREISPVFRAVIYDKAFREISRGQWDSKLVSVVKEHFPDEFAKRENNLFKYRVDDTSENYYDVEYRVLTALKRILKDDKYMDFILVSHEAVMRVIENTMKNRNINAPWTPPEPCEIRTFTL